MTRFKLHPYTVRIRRKREKEYLPLDNFDGYDFLTIIKNCLDDLSSAKIDDASQKTIFVKDYDPSDKQLIGILKSGEYGIAADFFDIETQELTPDARQPVHSELIPFFFLVDVPQNSDTGWLLVQRVGKLGVKGIFTKTIKNRTEFSDYMLEFKRRVSKDAFEKLKNNESLQVTFIRHSVPKNISERLGIDAEEEIVEKRTFSVSPSSAWSERLYDWFSNKETTFFEVSDDEYQEAKVEVKIGDSKKILTFAEENLFTEFMPLDDYKTLEDGFPKYDYITDKAHEFLDDLKSEMGE